MEAVWGSGPGHVLAGIVRVSYGLIRKYALLYDTKPKMTALSIPGVNAAALWMTREAADCAAACFIQRDAAS